MKNRKMITALLGVAAIVVVAVLLLVIARNGKEKEDVTRIGFIMSGEKDEEGWNGMHYQGIKSACDEAAVELIVEENVQENTGACRLAVKELADKAVKLIILSSYGYTHEVMDLVKEYPDITFYSNCYDESADNVSCYFARIYQARYLAGVLAGMETKTNQIAYVAAMNNDEVNRGINAFTLGVKSVNPDAQVIVGWTGSWDDAKKEREMAKRLIQEKNADVITYHQNQSNVVDVAEELGVKSIGYHQVPERVSDKFLTAVCCDWRKTYQEIIRSFMQGKDKSSSNNWLGMDKGVVMLSDFSSAVSQEEKDAIRHAQDRIIAGQDVFSGEIYDASDVLRCGATETISDDELLEHMDWFVRGVVIYEE